MTHRRVAHISRRDFVARVEPVDLVHQVEDNPEDIEVHTRGDDLRMRHRTAGERAQHRDLTLHGPVAVGPRMRRRTTQDQRAPVDFHAHHHVLAAAGQGHDVGHIGTDALCAHPAA